MPTCDENLAYEFAHDPQAVMQDLFAAHDDFLRRMARLLCGNFALAEDLVQETWLRAWRSLQSLREGKAVRSWLMVILRRELARHCQRRDNKHLSFDACEHDPSEHCTIDMQIQVEQLLATLTDEERQLLLGHVLDGRSYQDLAQDSGTGTSTVGVRLHRLRKRLATV